MYIKKFSEDPTEGGLTAKTPLATPLNTQIYIYRCEYIYIYLFICFVYLSSHSPARNSMGTRLNQRKLYGGSYWKWVLYNRRVHGGHFSVSLVTFSIVAVYLSVCLYVYLSVCLCVCLHVGLSWDKLLT